MMTKKVSRLEISLHSENIKLAENRCVTDTKKLVQICSKRAKEMVKVISELFQSRFFHSFTKTNDI